MATTMESQAAARGDAAAASDTSNDSWRAERGVRLDDAGATFTVWAPSAKRVELHVASGVAEIGRAHV